MEEKQQQHGFDRVISSTSEAREEIKSRIIDGERLLKDIESSSYRDDKIANELATKLEIYKRMIPYLVSWTRKTKKEYCRMYYTIKGAENNKQDDESIVRLPQADIFVVIRMENLPKLLSDIKSNMGDDTDINSIEIERIVVVNSERIKFVLIFDHIESKEELVYILHEFFETKNVHLADGDICIVNNMITVNYYNDIKDRDLLFEEFYKYSAWNHKFDPRTLHLPEIKKGRLTLDVDFVKACDEYGKPGEKIDTDNWANKNFHIALNIGNLLVNEHGQNIINSRDHYNESATDKSKFDLAEEFINMSPPAEKQETTDYLDDCNAHIKKRGCNEKINIKQLHKMMREHRYKTIQQKKKHVWIKD